MPTRQNRPEPVEVTPEDFDIVAAEDAEEAAQAAVGSLFTIQGPEFEDIEWSIHRYRTRLESAQDPSGQKHEWVADITGELHGADLVAQIGGGTFRFFGFRSTDKGKRIVVNRLISLAGPRKDFSWTPPPAATPATNGHPDPTLVQLLANQQRQLDKIEARLNAPAAAPADPALQMAAMLGLVKGVLELVPKPAAAVAATLGPSPIKEIMDAVKMGVSLHENTGGGPERSTTELIVDKVLPVAERLAMTLATRRAPPPPQPVRRTVEAEVVTDRPAPTPTPPTGPPPGPPAPLDAASDKQEAEARMMTLVSSLVRAVAEEREPEDFANTVEDILLPWEVETLKVLSVQDLMTELVAGGAGRYPSLKDPQTAEYVGKVLAELRAEPASE